MAIRFRVILSIFIPVLCASADIRYAVEMLPEHPNWRHVAAVDINNRGGIAGWGNLHDSSYIRGFYKSETSQVTIAPLYHDTPSWVVPSRINERGQIVGNAGAGYSGTYAYEHAFLWSNGRTLDLQTLGGLRSWAYGINDIGEVVGSSMVKSAYWTRAFRWKDGVLTELPVIGKTDSSAAYDINNFGVIVGQSGSWYPRAVLWKDGAVVDLGALGRNPKSIAKAISDGGEIAGSSMTEYDGKTACVWRDGVITSLGYLPGGYSSEALDINESGQVVGTAAVGTYSTARAVLWQDGQIADLNELILDATRLKLEKAQSINDKGEIVASGQYKIDAITTSAGAGVILRPVTLVSIDVLPGNAKKIIDTRKEGIVPVLLMGSKEISAQEIIPRTVRFAGASVFASAMVEANRDKKRDLLLLFRTRQMKLDRYDKKGVLTGMTRHGEAFGGAALIEVKQ